MRALELRGGRLGLRTDHPDPEPAAGEALIRVVKAGICSTDLELVKGYAGFEGVLGHEFVGVVEACGEPSWVGRRVVGGINLGCGDCAECAGRGPEHCPRRRVLGIVGKDGVFADLATLPVGNLLPVPETLSDDEAVFAEPLAAALRIREQVTVRPSARTAVVGPGRLGLLVAQVLRLAGTRVVLFGRSEGSLALPRRMGLDAAPVEEGEADAYDLVVEVTGNAAGLAESLRLVRPRGTLVMKSTFEGAAPVDLTKLVVGEVRIVGSRCGPFAPALGLLASGAVEVRSLVEAEYPLAEGLRAMQHAARPGVRKVLLRPA